MRKLKIVDLKVSSFITESQKEIHGGLPASLTCEPVTCARACSETDGVHACKEETNGC